MTRFSKLVMEQLQLEEYPIQELYIDDIEIFFSKRQFKILKLKLKGHTNVFIANKLDLCPATITNEFKKMRKIIEEDYRNGNTETNRTQKTGS